jgi:outer membrane protein OmpA-like peptidoglycan-associated protein
MKKIAVPALMLSILTGCANVPNPYQSTAQFGGIGALAGAVAGAAINHDQRTKGALIGGAIGAVGGAVYGHHVDSLETDLRSKMLGSGITVKRDGDTVSLIVPDQVAFSTSSSTLTPQAMRALDEVSDAMRRFPDARLVVTSTNPGDAIANLDIARERAVAIAGQLARSGVDGERMTLRVEGGRSAATIEWSGVELLQPENRRQYAQPYTPQQPQYQQAPGYNPPQQGRPTYQPGYQPPGSYQGSQSGYRPTYRPMPSHVPAPYTTSATQRIVGNSVMQAVSGTISGGPQAGLRAGLGSVLRDGTRAAVREANTEIIDYQRGYDR